MINYEISKYKLVRKLGAGAFGEIFQGIDKKTGQEVAIKFENANSRNPQLFFEAKVYMHLLKGEETSDRIPRIYHCGTEGDKNVMVMDLLGSSLEDLFNTCNRKFSLKTVLLLGDQMISRIEFIHSRYILHRDIKPDNFAMGVGTKQHRVFLIDFGLAKKYVSREGKHIPYKGGKSLTGTARYASVNTHLGIEQSRRDDLESLGYVLMYFLRGSLPWQNMKATDKKDKYKKIMEKKLETPLEILCKGFPHEFVTYLSYCKNLKFEEKPDYNYLRNLFKDLCIKSGYTVDYMFDWALLSAQKKDEANFDKIKDDNVGKNTSTMVLKSGEKI